MRIPKVYIETSVFNFVFADDAPDKREDTAVFFEEIRQKKYIPYTSSYVINELIRAPAEKKEKMFGIIEELGVTILQVDIEAERLASIYTTEGIIPQKYRTDAVHIAVTAKYDLDFIVSYNFKHIVKRKTIVMTEGVNLREGYKRVGIFTPTEVIDNAD